MKSRISLLILIVVCFLIQTTMLGRIAIGQIKPNLLLILCVCMGLMRGRKRGLWTGFAAGLLIDLFFGAVFGFYALVYMYVGYFSGYAHMIYYDDDIKVPLGMTACADLVYNLAVYCLQFLLRGRVNLQVYLFRIILPEVFYTTILALIVYYPIRSYVYRFDKPYWKEGASIWVIK